MNSSENNQIQAQPAKLRFRLAAMLYDSLLLIGIILLAVTLFTLPLDMIGGPDTSKQLLEQDLFHFLYQLYLLAVGMGFFIWFWTHGGQTLGMKVWRLKLVDENGNSVDFSTALKRGLYASLGILLFGIGLWWQLFDRNDQTLYDKWTNTFVVRLPKN